METIFSFCFCWGVILYSFTYCAQTSSNTIWFLGINSRTSWYLVDYGAPFLFLFFDIFLNVSLVLIFVGQGIFVIVSFLFLFLPMLSCISPPVGMFAWCTIFFLPINTIRMLLCDVLFAIFAVYSHCMCLPIVRL